MSHAKADLERLLAELEGRKKWLDVVIAGLESAVDSREYRLVEALERIYGSSGTARIELSPEAEAVLQDLATQVPRRAAVERRPPTRAASADSEAA